MKKSSSLWELLLRVHLKDVHNLKTKTVIMKLKIFVSLLIFVCALFINRVDSTQIEFDGRAYSNIVVAVSPDIPNTQARTIINNLQVSAWLSKLQHVFYWFVLYLKNQQFMIRKASSVLYRATRQKAYIQDVRILIPESWNNIQSNISTWETFNVSFKSLYVSKFYL